MHTEKRRPKKVSKEKNQPKTRQNTERLLKKEENKNNNMKMGSVLNT